MKSFLTFTVIATTTIFKIPLIIVALVVHHLPHSGHITKALEVSNVDKTEFSEGGQSWRDICSV